MNETIMVTGGTGYLGSWVVKELLENGYTVRVCVRDKNNKDKVTHLMEIAERSSGKIELWEADLMKKGSFDEAARGSNAIFHMASPFTLRYHDPKKELLDPAMEGTRNVLQAATNSGTVKKVVFTSSVVAVYGDNKDMKEQGLSELTESNFTYSSSLKHQPYSYSKVMAEKEAWKIAGEQNQWKLVVVNPAFIMGPPLTTSSDSESLSFMKDILQGRYRMGASDLMFGFVDVRDVAHAHRLALENDQAEGRHIISALTMGIMDVANIIRSKYGDRFKLPVMMVPKFLVLLVGRMFDLTAKFVYRNIGYPVKLNNSKSVKLLGMTYRPIENTILEMVEQMLMLKIINC